LATKPIIIEPIDDNDKPAETFSQKGTTTLEDPDPQVGSHSDTQTANSFATLNPPIGEDFISDLSDKLKETFNHLDPELIEINNLCEVLELDAIKVILLTIAIEVDTSARWHTRTKMNETLTSLIGFIDRDNYISIQTYFIRYSKCYHALRYRKQRSIPTQKN